MVRASLPRKYSAILMADVEGYSRLIGSDEVTAVRLLTLTRKILETQVTRFTGNLFSVAGDGFMVDFSAIEQAVNCAVEIQKAMTRMNARHSKMPIWLRIGIAIGEIVEDGRGKYGNAINVAARVQAMADTGGVCITDAVYERIADRLPYAFDHLGPTHLKNISQAIDLVKVRWAETPAARARRPGPKVAAPPSLAVLPFTFQGSQAGKSYFADGLAEEIINELSRYRWLAVVSKSSSFAYKGRDVDDKLVARELGVRYLIEGKLRRDSAGLQIGMKLVDGETGAELWSGQFSRSLQEVFELQEDIVLGIVSAIEPKVRSAEIQRSRKTPTDSLTAYDYYLQALPHRTAFSDKDNRLTLEFLQKAIKLDNRFAPALAMASMCYTARKDQGWGALSKDETKTALDLAQAAIKADYNDATALQLSAHTIASVGGDLSQAIFLIDRALTISPSNAEAWMRSSMIRIYAGDIVTAEEHANNAVKLGPLDERIYMPLCALGYCCLFSGRYIEAIELTRRALLGRPRPPMAYIIQLAASRALGDAKAIELAMESLMATAPRFSLKDWLAQSCFVEESQIRILASGFENRLSPARVSN
jgi:TolB-like protein